MVYIKANVPKKVKTVKAEKLAKVEKVKNSKSLKTVGNSENKVRKNKLLTVKQSKEEFQNSSEETKVEYVLPSKAITADLVDKSLSALQQLNVHYKKKNSIFEDEPTIFAEIKCIKIQNSKGNIKFLLPHSTLASTGEVCLITPDLKKGKKIDHEPTVEHWEELLRNAGVTSIKTVLPLRQLRVEYDQFELKRRLLTQHDYIMVDTRVLNHTSHLLGKKFFKKHNMLIPVRVDEKNKLKKNIETGLRTAMLRLSEGATSTLTVGHTGMAQKAIKENILAFIDQLKSRFPGGEANIRSLSLKLPLSLSLPLYVTLRSSSTINVPKLKQQKPKNFTVLEDELSTIPGSTVRVAPDGTVHLKKSTEISDMEDDEEESDNE